MSITTILFDLDGTLLPMDQDSFLNCYLSLLARKLEPHGYEPGKLVKSILKGTGAMINNDGSKMNESAFWETFCGIYGDCAKADLPIFDEFYRTDFDNVRASCGYSEKAAETVREIKKMGFRIALATNPLFPPVATEKRIRFAGLEPGDFELYTTYENSRYCKPNLNYYKDVVSALGVECDECVMVGNDVSDDMVAERLGMKVFLLTDCLINKECVDISKYPHGGFDDLLTYVVACKNNKF